MCTKPSDDADGRSTATNKGKCADGNLNNKESNGALSSPTPSANNPEMSAATYTLIS